MPKAQRVDLTGKRFGRWLVLGRAPGYDRHWLCRCECGLEKPVYSPNLTRGKSSSCSRCLTNPAVRKPLAGVRFGLLVAVKPIGFNEKRSVIWECHCDCGGVINLTAHALGVRKRQHCGCIPTPQTLAVGVSAFNRMWGRYLKRAEQAGLAFTLTKEEFHLATQLDCHYCGQSPTKAYSTPGTNGAFVGNGLDRKNNAQGYTSDNAVPCCEMCNRAKRAHPLKTFTEWLGRIADHRINAEWERVAFACGC